MKKIKRCKLRSVAVYTVILLLSCTGMLSAEELEMINRPVNISGLTGLIETTAPYTLPARTVELSTGIMTEQSYLPDFSLSTTNASITYGIAGTWEIALKGSYLSEEESHVLQRRGAGDAELSAKWNFLPPKEYSSRPAVSLFFGGIAPTGDRDEGTNSVEHWGVRLGLAIGSEVLIEDYVMGIYADGQAIAQDLSDTQKRVLYHRANMGVLLPISKYRNLQMFVEYNRQKGKDVTSVHDEDHSAMTYGLRLVSTRFNLTIGTQFINRFDEGMDNTSKVSFLVSLKL